MNDNYKKEILLVSKNIHDINFLSAFLRQCNLNDKLIYISSEVEALNFLLDEAHQIKLIIVGMDNNYQNQLTFIQKIRKTSILKFIPMAVITSTWTNIEIESTKDTMINMLAFRPIDFIKFKSIIAFAGYTI